VVPGWELRTWPDVVGDHPAEPTTPASGDGPALVVGLGPGDWRGGADVFLRVAAALRALPGHEHTRFAWLGLDAEDGRSFPYLFDADHLGLADAVRWVSDHDGAVAALREADAVLVTDRAEFPLDLVHPVLDVVGPLALDGCGVPVVAFDTPAARRLVSDRAELVTYPDVGAAAAALGAAIGRGRRGGLDELLDRVVDDLLGAPA
jgi:glycosyltransferase involved in cell wall biosynthesis